MYFDYDDVSVRGEYDPVVAANAAFLNANPDFTVVVQGNCDERGSREYNLALGHKRANNARSFLDTMGVEHERLQSTSYGKERPYALEHDESAWSQNRRAVSVVQ